MWQVFLYTQEHAVPFDTTTAKLHWPDCFASCKTSQSTKMIIHSPFSMKTIITSFFYINLNHGTPCVPHFLFPPVFHGAISVIVVHSNTILQKNKKTICLLSARAPLFFIICQKQFFPPQSPVGFFRGQNVFFQGKQRRQSEVIGCLWAM